MATKTESAAYTHGHHASVLRSHSWRTAANSAGYLLPHLTADMSVLDIGCGPGTITIDLARHLPQGHVTGLDRAGTVLSSARAMAADSGQANVAFVEGDANSLAFPDDSFDVVVCHQVLQHVGDPIGVLREMRRVAKPGGIVAARESDFGGFIWYPEVETLGKWREVYSAVARCNGGEPNAGRMLHVWAKRAGFEDVRCSLTAWCLSGKEDVAWWAGSWAERTVASATAKTAVDAGLAKGDDLESIANAWRDWGEHEDAWISIPSAEVICFKK